MAKLQPEHGEGGSDTWPADLIFGRDFDQSMDKVNLPAGLLSLTFGSRFDQSMDR